MAQQPSLQGHIEDPNDEDYARASLAALKQKDPESALELAAAALALAPHHTAHRQLLDRILSAVKAPLVFLTLPEKGAFYGLWAARARALARARRYAEALSVLFQVVQQHPSVAYLPWAVEWLTPARAARRVQLDEMAAEVLRYREVALPLRDAGVAVNLQACADLLERLARRERHNRNVMLARSTVLRSLGKAREAWALLESDHSPVASIDSGAGDRDSAVAGRANRHPSDELSWSLAVERAAVCAALGEHADRRLWLERALELRPKSAATALDLADDALDNAELSRGLSFYLRALKSEPDNLWARLGRDYVAAVTPAKKALIEPGRDSLAVYQAEFAASVQPIAEPLHKRWASLRRDLTAYDTRLADPVDPLVSLLRAVSKQLRQGGQQPLQVKARGCAHIGPSVQRAFQLQLAATLREGTLRASEQPHLGSNTAPLWAHKQPLWSYEQGCWQPRVPAPPRQLSAEVDTLIGQPFVLAHWSKVARETQLTSADFPCLRGGLVHLPPLPSPHADGVRWVHAHQVATALLIASVPAAGEEALALFASLLGSDDWVEAAAWLGLLQLASRRDDLVEPIVSLVNEHAPAVEAALTPGVRALVFIADALLDEEAGRSFQRLRARLRRLHS